MKVFILTEGGNNNGFGHITRCLSIYQVLETKNIPVELILNADQTVIDLIKGKNVRFLDWSAKESVLFDLIKDTDIVFIDSYLAKLDLYQKIQKIAGLTVCIDDNNRLTYPEGVVVNGNIYAEDLDFPPVNKYLLGPQYIPLRDAFLNVPEKVINDRVSNVLITLGGNDTVNIIGKITELLNNRFPELDKTVLFGSQPDSSLQKNDNKTTIFYNLNAEEMKEQMLRADFAISGSGQTLYEMARIGVPVIAVGLAENQVNNIKGWEKVKFIDFAGMANEPDTYNNIAGLIEKIMAKEYRTEKSKIGRKYVDGLGCQRILDYLLSI
jgi:UDP-2,4-diacetamido-2,4,6-trideoxy-beta-L-altropyranose hydrolase